MNEIPHTLMKDLEDLQTAFGQHHQVLARHARVDSLTSTVIDEMHVQAERLVETLEKMQRAVRGEDWQHG